MDRPCVRGGHGHVLRANEAGRGTIPAAEVEAIRASAAQQRMRTALAEWEEADAIAWEALARADDGDRPR
ncbi:hypothetical protein ACIBO2_37205 [Nonomuraea sp. NPDC050022]|uniref:hypothetical protein n=1 Tax=unclassified Nonomuraea TaxID=2593643 RepID=UPI0033C92E7B